MSRAFPKARRRGEQVPGVRGVPLQRRANLLILHRTAGAARALPARLPRGGNRPRHAEGPGTNLSARRKAGSPLPAHHAQTLNKRKMNAFSRRYLEGLEEVDGFILKAKSPSCAIADARIFPAPSTRSEQIRPGAGPVRRRRARSVRLPRVRRREPDLNDRQVSARFSSPESSHSPPSGKPGNQAAPSSLTRYHAENKLLFMAYRSRNNARDGTDRGES